MSAAPTIAVLHGPNLNLLGRRQPEIYGRTTLDEINQQLVERAAQHGLLVEAHQSNVEGELVTLIQDVGMRCGAIVINPGAYTHTSVAIADAIAGVLAPAIEVHLSNLHKREAFRKTSYVAAVCVGTISGFGPLSYRLGLDVAIELIAAARSPR